MTMKPAKPIKHPQSAILDAILRDAQRQANMTYEQIKPHMPAIQNAIKKAKEAYENSKPLKMRLVMPSKSLPDNNIRKTVLETIKNLEKRKKVQKKITICLDSSNVLYKEPKKRLNCILEGKIQRAILKTLNQNFTDTDSLQKKIESKSKDAVRKAVGVINRKAKLSLKLKNPLIESIRGKGYRINPEYKLKFS